ncbi:protein ATP6V1FNB-like isoform X1 [Schistocerca americana]|uniref:protein ATP6V1FNB-like isoform X1 n=1 Tax=Schistocerca americana TaxID=7009 RepID=UPI001F4FCBF1|nr:protein ATP6V1FNB-like isoform X1 [Schistocerca americana]
MVHFRLLLLVAVMSGKQYPLGYDPQILSVLYATENRLRTRWFFKNLHLLQQIIADAPRLAEGEADRRLRELQQPQLLQLRTRPRFLKTVRRPPPPLPPPDPEVQLDSMRPPSPRTKQLIYSQTGPYEYLKARCAKPPNHRYYLPETTNFSYGWQSDELYARVYNPPYGRSTQSTQQLYRRQGVKPDSPSIRPAFIFVPLEKHYI